MNGKHKADEAVFAYLRRVEREMDNFGSALPENAGRAPHRLAVTRTDEYDFGWVYYYNSEEYKEFGDFLHSLVGNAPLIVDRATCKLYSTGTARPVEYYVEEFRNGIRRPLD
jgi:hypothetical protein